MATPRDDSPWQDHAHDAEREELQAPSTQIVADREAYLGQGRYDVGRRISDDQVELFASADAAGALRHEFALHQPKFVALHDVGSSASLRLLASLAGATNSRVHKLTVRKQGHGIAMAVLQFVQVPMADGTPVRVYATDLSADALTRASLAQTLLAHSSLGVLLMGVLSPTALASQLKPLSDAVGAGPWPNRELLMLPLGSGVALAGAAAQLAGQSGVAVQVTPHAGKTQQAWGYIAGAWNRLHSGTGGVHALPSEFRPLGAPAPAAYLPQSEAPTQPMGLHASLRRAAVAAHAAPSPAHGRPAPAVSPWQVYVDNCCLLKGAVACCAFDTLSMHPLAHAGHANGAEALAEQGAKLLRSMVEAARTLGLAASASDGTVTAGSQHLVVRPVPGHPGVALHLVLSSAANLTLAKLQLERISPPSPLKPAA